MSFANNPSIQKFYDRDEDFGTGGQFSDYHSNASALGSGYSTTKKEEGQEEDEEDDIPF